MQGTSKTASLMMMAAMSGMLAGGGGANNVREVKLDGFRDLEKVSRRKMGRIIGSVLGSFRGNSASGAPVGTFWAGDGVRVSGQTRQMRRARERSERKAEEFGTRRSRLTEQAHAARRR